MERASALSPQPPSRGPRAPTRRASCDGLRPTEAQPAGPPAPLLLWPRGAEDPSPGAVPSPQPPVHRIPRPNLGRPSCPAPGNRAAELVRPCRGRVGRGEPRAEEARAGGGHPHRDCCIPRGRDGRRGYLFHSDSDLGGLGDRRPMSLVCKWVVQRGKGSPCVEGRVGWSRAEHRAPPVALVDDFFPFLSEGLQGPCGHLNVSGKF